MTAAPGVRASVLAIAVVGLMTLGARGAVTPPQTVRHHFTPHDRETGRYQYVPIEVPAGTRQLTVSYSYDRQNGDNVVDLGLFEPGPLDLHTKSFRGWSGGSRNSVSIASDAATPGYVPGPVPAGLWHVALGLYKVAASGVDVEVTFETTAGPDAPTPRMTARSAAALRPGPAWFSGDLHTHTLHSDGSVDVAALTKLARDAGLDFIAITDHNNTTHQYEQLPSGPLLRIAGEEVTTPNGHANVWGLGPGDWVDFRVSRADGIAPLVSRARSYHALFSINHPTGSCLACDWTHEIPPVVDGIEIWNGPFGPQMDTIAIWDQLLRTGRRITGVGSSDWHRAPAPIGMGSVRVYARELSTTAILDGIREGRVIVMADARTPAVDLTVMSGDAAAQIGDTIELAPSGVVLVGATVAGREGGNVDLYLNGTKAASEQVQHDGPVRFRLQMRAGGYIRVHVRDNADRIVAITNPVYVTAATPGF